MLLFYTLEKIEDKEINNGKIMKNLSLLLFVIVALCVSGCRSLTQNYNIVYKPKTCDRGKIAQGESLFVADIIDERGKDEQNPFDQNDPMILVPLWPYSYAEVNPVIKYSYFQAGLKDALSRLIAQDLAASELFKELQVAQTDDNPQLQPQKGAYQLILKLKKATWKRYLTSYGLSYAGVYLWFILPKSYGSVILTMEATLKEPKNNKVIANEVFSHEVSTIEWIYGQMNYQPPISEFALEESFPKIMTSVRKMLLKSLKEAK